MTYEYKTARLAHGVFSQSAVQKVAVSDRTFSARGLKVRAIVLNTYVTDTPSGVPSSANELPKGNRNLDGIQVSAPRMEARNVYCDVFVYTSMRGVKQSVIPRVLVAQDGGGLHTGELWVPRATTQRIDGEALDVETLRGINPGGLDGDHVLVEFMDDDLWQPIITRNVPHPGRDVGNEEKGTGVRSTRLKQADGFPKLMKFNGVVYGVDAQGNYVIDATRGHTGVYDSKGREPRLPGDPADSAESLVPDGPSGNVIVALRAGAKAVISVLTDPANPGDAATREASITVEDGIVTIAVENAATGGTPTQVKIEDNKVTLVTQGGAGIEVTDKDADAKLKIGDGAMHAVIEEHLELMWARFMAKVDAWNITGAAGTNFVTIVGPAFQVQPLQTEPWDPTIKSSKVTLPDG